MELYKLTGQICKEAVSAAKNISSITGKCFLCHYFDAIWCFVRYGCSPRQYSTGGFYRFRSFERKEMYTGGRSHVARKIFNTGSDLHLLYNKVDFNTMFSEQLKRDWLSCETATPEEIKAFVENHDKVVVKPLDGMKGHGISLLDDKTKETVSEFVGQKILLEECIERHSALILNSKSVNTIRLITIKDSKGKVHFLKAGLRCGVGDSFVDNLSTGGVAYPVNIEHGRIEEPGVGGSYTAGSQDFVYYHPGTETFMLGYEIPFWKETLELAEKSAAMLENIRFVGWDIAITPDGPVLVEGNSRPGPSIMEEMGQKRGMYKVIMSCR